MRSWINKLGSLALAFCSFTGLNAQCIEYDKSVDFSKYNTFGFKAGEVFYNGNKLENSSEYELIKSQLINELHTKGLSYSEENPDIELSFVMEIEKDSTIERVPPIPYIYSNGTWTKGGLKVSKTQGLLIVDLKDAQTDKTVWRSGNSRRIKSKNH